jgi:hypothetical protein
MKLDLQNARALGAGLIVAGVALWVILALIDPRWLVIGAGVGTALVVLGLIFLTRQWPKGDQG